LTDTKRIITVYPIKVIRRGHAPAGFPRGQWHRKGVPKQKYVKLIDFQGQGVPPNRSNLQAREYRSLKSLLLHINPDELLHHFIKKQAPPGRTTPLLLLHMVDELSLF